MNSAAGTVDIVNGDFLGASNITVQDSGYTTISSFAAGVFGAGEKWLLVSPKLPAGSSSSSPISINAAGNDVAFVNASGLLVHDRGTSTGWNGPAAIGGSARSDSPVVENAAGTLVVFIAPSGQVMNDWANSTGWHGPAAIGGTSR